MAQLMIPMDAKRFATGMTWKDYMAQMGDTRARTEANYANSGLTEDEKKFFIGINGVRYVVMLAENWCGDVHRNSPLMAHICEAIPGCELRVFFRDKETDLRDILQVLASPRPDQEVKIPPNVLAGAQKGLERMFAMTNAK